MSDDKSKAPGDEDELVESPETDVSSAQKPAIPPGIALAFVLIAVVGALVMIFLRNGVGGGSAAKTSNLSSLQAEVNALSAERNRQRADLGLPPVPGSGEAIEDIAARLKKDTDSLVALAATYQQMMAEKDALLAGRNAEIIKLEKMRQTLIAGSASLQQDLQRALVNGSDADRLRSDLADVRAQRDALAAELKNRGQGVPSDDYEDLKKRYEETLRAKEFFEARVKELQGDLNNAKLFANSESELLPAAVELFRSLRKLENTSDAEQLQSYSALTSDLGVKMMQKVDFETGSSHISPDTATAIQNMVGEVPDGDLLLVVGYASRTGNPESNQRLSSDRATGVAEYFSGLKRPGQLVQAVYIGQTARFSSRIPERNQICEIWQIRKK